MKFRLSILTVIFSIICEVAVGAGNYKEAVITNPVMASGLYRPYPATGSDRLTTAPEGYRPFYISHYGRHGSRWLDSSREYDIARLPFDRADSAGVLTDKGREVFDKIKRACDNSQGKEGCLAPIGFTQHRGIAERMISNFPDVFANEAEVDARSTLTVRCVMSMNAFCRRLSEINPDIKFNFESSPLTTSILGHIYGVANPIDSGYINYGKNGNYLKISEAIIRDKMNSEKFLKSLFKENIFDSETEKLQFLYYLYYLACDQYNVMPDNMMLNMYSPEQLYWMAVAENFRCYAKRGSYPGVSGWTMKYASPLLQDIVTRADSAITQKGNAADLRFGHDSIIMGLAPLMGIDGYDIVSEDPEEVFEKWNLSDMTPMGANIQLIFFRPIDGSDRDILVKILFNEKESSLPIKSDMAPYYRWKDVRNHFNKKISESID